jgi:hypothetical protein
MTTYKILGQTLPVANTETDAYTTPSASSTLIRSINVTNTSGTADTFDISIVEDGVIPTDNKDYIFKSTPILGNETITVKAGYTMSQNDKVRVRSNNGTSNFHVFGAEI